ncbi:MAG: sugar phosphate isomerase/epimerase [Candidatus Accumulibacter sp.]|jgi:sugar phosphate isomerase/epimerase|nr:sugar phosphate isomerase/epimerase [Accumulibacter sp.]
MKLAVCNELFGRISLDEVADVSKRHGFGGIELAPFTIFGDFDRSAVQRGIGEAKRALAAAGMRFAGFHWLLARPDGLHITTPDGALRRKSWDHLRRLIDAAAELGGGNLILGSPRQRSTTPGQSRREAIGILTEELAAIAPFAAERGSPILLEALSSDQTDVVNLLSEVSAIVEQVGNPGVDGMFDFHNCADEADSHASLIDRHIGMIRHVHLNDPKGDLPLPGDRAYLPAFVRLRALRYDGWVSLEIFSLPEDPAEALRQTAAYIGDIEEGIECSESLEGAEKKSREEKSGKT